jgi:O-acetylserine/cysteine efflux transporter
VLFQACPATVLGFGTWSFLLRRYPAAVVAPFTLLVPVVGMVSGALCLGEAMPGWKLASGLLMVGGLALGQARRRQTVAPSAAGGPGGLR